MTLKIMEIVIYSHDGRKRVLELNHEGVSIVTGASKTGKSALIDIVDYCFGSGECRVPDGPIRHSVAWFGLRLKLKSGEAFIARRCPSGRFRASEECFVQIGVSAESPVDLRQTTNSKGLSALLSGWTGITENIYEPPSGQTRPSLSASIRHAVAFCFQPQDEIIRRHQLFHGADDNFVAQGLKDTLPYFLGAVDEEYVRKREELRRLRDSLRAIERQIGELNAINGSGAGKASALLAQARDIGLSAMVSENWQETIAALKDVAMAPLGQTKYIANGEYRRLSEDRRKLLQMQRKFMEELDAVRTFERDARGYSNEVAEQHSRLVSIGIFENSDPENWCPLCSQILPEDNRQPKLIELRGALHNVASRLKTVVQNTPRIERAASEAATRLDQIRTELTSNRQQLEAVRAANETIQFAHDEIARCAAVQGRISLYLESIPDLPDTGELLRRAGEVRLAYENLEKELSEDVVVERMTSISSIMSRKMSMDARSLMLEHSASPLRLDAKRLTLVADTENGPVPMSRMGSGENWVGYHLIAHLNLHDWFSRRDRPVPRFIFFDQPSQVYFPSEPEVAEKINVTDLNEDDRSAVKRMFEYIFSSADAALCGFQVIITEHADIDEGWYQSAVVERWRGGKKLVPDDWPRIN